MIDEPEPGPEASPESLDDLPIPEEEKQRIVAALLRMMEMGMGGVYGIEDEGIPDAAPPCSSLMQECKARCCSLAFALTKEEVQRGIVAYDRKKPFFIARGEDGYCAQIDRKTLRCIVYEDRPLRCRRYDCRHS